jgi:hypothetical protein
MRVDHVPCGPFVNASEEQAFNHVSNRLKAERGEDRFVILTNVAHAVTSGAQADEIDMVIVGSTGVHVIEVKHWDRGYLKLNRLTLEDEADKVASKVRKVATKVRRFLPAVGFITPKILLTKESKTVQRDFSEPIRGARLFALTDWRALVDLDTLGTIQPQQINELCHAIVPKSRVPLSGDLRKLGRITDMHLLSPREDRFHRVYRGRDSIYQDRLIVHLYDSIVVFWLMGSPAAGRHACRWLGAQCGEAIFGPLPTLEALGGRQDQGLNPRLRLLTTRFPKGLHGHAALHR